MWSSLSPAGFLLCFLLLDGISSAPLPAGFPVVDEASSLIVEVEDTKTNVTLSFTILIITEEDEGSRTRGPGGSDSSSSSSEEVTLQDFQPMASLLPVRSETSSQPMREEDRSEEMMLDQRFNASSRGNLKPKQNFNHFTNSLTESKVHQTFSASEDFNNIESREINEQKGRTGLDDADHKNRNEPESSLSDALDDFNNSTEGGLMKSHPPETICSNFTDTSLSLEITEMNPNLQRIRLREVVLDSVSQEVTSSSSEESSAGSKNKVSYSRSRISKDIRRGSRLQEELQSIQEPLHLLTGNQGVDGVHHEVQDSLVLTSWTDLMSSDDTEDSSETVHSDPTKQTDAGLDPDSDESLESTKVQQGTRRNSTQKIIDPTTGSI